MVSGTVNLLNEDSSTNKDHQEIKYFFAGGFGGICTVILGFPFDTIKVKLQAMPKPPAGQPPMYTGTWDCLIKTIKREGYLGLYRGMSAPVIGVAPIMAISFFAFSAGKSVVNSTEDAILTNLELFAAGTFSGFFTTAMMAPGERIKCILQVQQSDGTRVYKGPVDVVRQLYREGGIRSIYRGTLATLLRDVPGSGLYFMTYESLQRHFNPVGAKPTVYGTIVSGGSAGIVFWVVGCPADVIKTRMQTAPEGTYRGLGDAFSQLMREGDGLRALYRGCLPIMARSFPANACCFTGFELAMHYLNKM